MAYVLTEFTVKDLMQWKVVFDEFISTRKRHTSRGAQAFRVVGEDGSVVVLTEFTDIDRAIEMYESQEFKEAIRRAGVIGTEKVKILEEIDRLSA